MSITKKDKYTMKDSKYVLRGFSSEKFYPEFDSVSEFLTLACANSPGLSEAEVNQRVLGDIISSSFYRSFAGEFVRAMNARAMGGEARRKLQVGKGKKYADNERAFKALVKDKKLTQAIADEVGKALPYPHYKPKAAPKAVKVVEVVVELELTDGIIAMARGAYESGQSIEMIEATMRAMNLSQTAIDKLSIHLSTPTGANEEESE
jgi:hypothetical protein